MFIKNWWIYLANWDSSEERRGNDGPLVLIRVPQTLAVFPLLHLYLPGLLNNLRRRRWEEVFVLDDRDLRSGRLPRLKERY